jgi:FixJ family two-component response regulator
MPAKRRVHIVDDEPDIRRALGLMLAAAGIETRVYGSAEDYLAAMPIREPACVLLDNRLPGSSGLELLARFAEARSEAAVIMMTGHGDVPTAVAAMKLGAFHFVEKPFDSEALLTVVEEALSRAASIHDLQEESRQFNACRDQLTPREIEVFALLMEGLPTKSIASRLGITARTAEHHRSAVFRKFNARSISHLMRMALRSE